MRERVQAGDIAGLAGIGAVSTELAAAIEAAMRVIEGTARSMGVTVEGL